MAAAQVALGSEELPLGCAVIAEAGCRNAEGRAEERALGQEPLACPQPVQGRPGRRASCVETGAQQGGLRTVREGAGVQKYPTPT